MRSVRRCAALILVFGAALNGCNRDDKPEIKTGKVDARARRPDVINKNFIDPKNQRPSEVRGRLGLDGRNGAPPVSHRPAELDARMRGAAPPPR